MLFPTVLKMTPTEQFPLLFFSDHATDKLENLSDTKLRLPSQYKNKLIYQTTSKLKTSALWEILLSKIKNGAGIGEKIFSNCIFG